MVWYNITAYNIKVKFVLRNNKEKVICNNKNAEGVMQMKCKRNLERAIVLGLILSTGVCGSAWAEDLVNENLWVNGDGNAEGLVVDKTEYENVKLIMNGVAPRRTTMLLGIKGKNFTVNGNEIVIVNQVSNKQAFGNNDALYAMGGANVKLNADHIFIKSVGSTGFFNFGDNAITAKNNVNSEIFNVNNSIEVSGGDVQIIGDLDVVGELKYNTGIENKIKLTMSSDKSFWYGDEKNSSGIVDVSLSNGAEWIYDTNSTITALTLDEGGIVNLQDEDIKQKYEAWDISEYRSSSEHKSVTIENLKGTGGIFKVDLDWNVNQGVNYGDSSYYSQSGSDYIYIENVDNTTKTNPVQIVDFDASKAHLENMEINKDKLYFANVENGTTSFITASSVYSNAGNVFDYTYGTGSEDDVNDGSEDWYIAVSGKSAESNPNFSAAKGAMYAGYALGTELDTLNKRIGEARYLEEDDGVWVRYRHSKTGWDDTYETNGDMFQLGFDNEVTEKDGKHYRGVAIDYTDADTNIMGISGEGEHERYAVSLYDTWLGEKGHYRDLVLRGGRINSDYDISGAFSSGYEDIGGDYHQWFGSISAEWGRKNDMGTGWYFEPQVQAQLVRIGGASYVSDSGVDVDQDGATSLIGRAGFRIGREYVKDNGKHDNFYIKADLLHEFAGDKSFSLTGNDGRYDKEYDGQETWCDVGIGADISLGKNSYFWADVERTFGADFDNTWQINGGFRWEF